MGSWGRRCDAPLSQEKLPPHDTVLGNPGKGRDMAEQARPPAAPPGATGGQDRPPLGARAVPHVSETPARSWLVQRAAAAFGSGSTRYRSPEEGGVSSSLPEAPTQPCQSAYTILFVNIYLFLLIYKVLWSKVLFPCVTSSSSTSRGAEIHLQTSLDPVVHLTVYDIKMQTLDLVQNAPPEFPNSA